MLALRLYAGLDVITEAVVDSGASRSFFPRRVAQALGIAGEIEAAGVADGVESSFRIWRARAPLLARVLDPDQTQRVPWGPPLELSPAFSDLELAVLGRADFFRHFRITFAAASLAMPPNVARRRPASTSTTARPDPPA